jgi:hypothetical protein
MRLALLVTLLPIVGSGCRKDCTSQPPGFLLNVTVPAAVDPARVSCLRLTVDSDRRAVDVTGKLGSRRTSVGVLNVGPTVVSPGAGVTVEACASCPGSVNDPGCTGQQAVAGATFTGTGDACNVFELTLGATADGGPPDARPPDGPRDRSPFDVRNKEASPKDSFPSVPDSMNGYSIEAKQAVQWLLGRGFYKSSICGGGIFCPTADVKRREVAYAVVRWYYWRINQTVPTCAAPDFNDVLCGDQDADYILEAKAKKAMEGEPGNVFGPEKVASRFHAAKPIAVLRYQTPMTGSCPALAFTDLDGAGCPNDCPRCLAVSALVGNNVCLKTEVATCPSTCTSSSCFCPYANLDWVTLAVWMFRANDVWPK